MRRVAAGDAVFSPRLAGFVLDAFAGDRSPPVDPELDALTAREREILQLLMTGASNKLIAIRLGIAEATVKVHLKTLLRKIDVNNRTQAAIWAMHNGFTADGAPIPTRVLHAVSA